MKSTIFLDLDGVIRLWTGSEITLAELDLGLDKGSLFKVAFSQRCLYPAITGKITDEHWRCEVHKALVIKYGKDTAQTLTSAWEDSTYEIDYKLLESIKREIQSAQLILTTNATSKLKMDLQTSNLDSYFDVIVNSSEIGTAKPSAEYFEQALSIAKCDAADCLFVDDSNENVDTARKVGIKSELYINSEKTLLFLREKYK